MRNQLAYIVKSCWSSFLLLFYSHLTHNKIHMLQQSHLPTVLPESLKAEYYINFFHYHQLLLYYIDMIQNLLLNRMDLSNHPQ